MNGDNLVLFGFRAPRDLVEWFKRRAKREMTTASSLMRRLIQAYMAQVDSDALKRMREGSDEHERRSGT